MTTNDEEVGEIKQGTIAQFMRKRTQLVGFEFGYWKHVQYVAEFLDNALDAIETYQWKEREKEDSKIQFTIDRELSLENLSIVKSEKASEVDEDNPLDDEAKLALKQEFGIEESEEPSVEEEIPEEETSEVDLVGKEEIEVEEEVRNIMEKMDEIIRPVEFMIDQEPIVVIKLTEFEPKSFLTAEMDQKNVMGYRLEIFDNGGGMPKIDLEKYGKYLASSKSMELKQTRGSQGFGAPSAFSDSQNTTGMPIVVASKTADKLYANV